ncbi:hypothetical protein EX30DRAFT_271996 [Ascodesmis nigricans]|uniref:Zn(2)-C6 fungal-type domain-containing protein n=1 Tax=Ascodesmis nigricans TaxID=341454 RepID=A0A4S2MX85_9PEZI|nr:hypothetical protein EX30DRAFT_271996 [Ascodesmis nigricans]
MSAENQYTVHQGSGPGPYPPHQHAAVAHPPPFSGPASVTGNPGFGYREEHHVSFGGSADTGEMMTGVIGGPPVHHSGPHHYAYHEYIDPSHRPPPQSHPTTHHPPPPPPPGQPQWHEPNYENGIHTPMPESVPPGKPGIPEGPPISPHHTSRNWDKPQNGYMFNKSPSQDSNGYPQHSSVPSPQNQRHSQPALNRTIEPNAAPSPPTQYPGSPRTPLPQQMGPPAPGLPLPHKSHRPQSGQRTSLSISSTPSSAPHDGLDHRTFVEQPHNSPLRSSMEPFVPRHVSGGNSFASPGLPSHQQQYAHHRQGSFGDSRPQIQHRHSSDGRMYTSEDIKRENGSRVPSVSMSPAPMIGEVENSPNSKMESGETSKKRGVPAFRDPKTGIDYYENEYVPPDVLLPAGFQRGIGKQSQDLLLPLEKDGIQVNPEWGLTAGGKARQRLPAACRNCRQKKIKCV